MIGGATRAAPWASSDMGWTGRCRTSCSWRRPVEVLRPAPLARRFRANQVVLLEGDFNSYFTLYAPQGYGTDVRYVLTPDLMALLVDEAGSYDVETIDDTLVIYARKEFDLGDPATHERLLRLLATVGAKTVLRTRPLRRISIGPWTPDGRLPAVGGWYGRSRYSA